MDLAIGVPGEDLSDIVNAGAVQVMYGSASGLQARNELWHQNTQYMFGVTEPYDEFGSALAVGNFDGDAYDDLAIGVPGENVGGENEAGVVHILLSDATGPRDGTNLNFSLHLAEVPGTAHREDHYGSAIAAAFVAAACPESSEYRVINLSNISGHGSTGRFGRCPGHAVRSKTFGQGTLGDHLAADQISLRKATTLNDPTACDPGVGQLRLRIFTTPPGGHLPGTC